MIIIFALLLFAGAFGIKKVFNYSIEESLFLNILFIIAFLLVMGLLGVLNIGFYVVSALMAAVFIYGLIKTIKEKSFDIYEIITPGTGVVMASCVFYYVAVKNLGFHNWDEASHWSTAVLHMIKSGNMYYGLQTMGVPMFSYFTAQIVGYSESLIFLSKWIFIWSAITILMKDVKWKSWYIAVIGWVLSACVVNLIGAEPIYYMDMPLGVLGGVLIAYKVLNKKTTFRSYILLLLGVFVLSQIKDGTGFELAIFVTIFYLIDELIINKEKSKIIRRSLIVFIVSIASYFLSQVSKIDLPNYFTIKRFPDIEKVFSLFSTKSTLAISLLFIICVLVLLLLKCNIKLKQLRHFKFIKYSSLVLMIISLVLVVRKLIGSIYLSLSSVAQGYFKDAMHKMFYESYFSQPTYMLLFFIIIFSVFIGLAIHKKELKRYISGNIFIVIMVLMHGLALIFSYTFIFEDWEAATLICFNRYFGFMIIAVSLYISSAILYKDDLFTNKKYMILAILAMSLIFLRKFPLPDNLLFKQNDNAYISYEYGIKEYGKEAALDINSIISEDSKVFMVCQNNGAQWTNSGVYNWIHYYIVPREVNFVNFSFGKQYDESDVRTINLSLEDLNGQIDGYDYVYIDNADDAFYDIYGSMFDVLPIQERAIYKVESDGINLVWQGESIR